MSIHMYTGSVVKHTPTCSKTYERNVMAQLLLCFSKNGPNTSFICSFSVESCNFSWNTDLSRPRILYLLFMCFFVWSSKWGPHSEEERWARLLSSHTCVPLELWKWVWDFPWFICLLCTFCYLLLIYQSLNLSTYNILFSNDLMQHTM